MKKQAKNMVLQNDEKDTMAFQVVRKLNKVIIDYYHQYEYVQTIKTTLDKGAEIYYNAINNDGFKEAF